MYTLVQFDLASRIFQAVQSLLIAMGTAVCFGGYSSIYAPVLLLPTYAQQLVDISLHHKPYHIGTRVFKESPKTMSEESIKGFCNVACFEEFTIFIGSGAIHVSP